MEELKIPTEEVTEVVKEPKTSKYFCFILYPSEDPKHADIFRYLLNKQHLFETVYIEHEPEPLTEQEQEENHNERKRHTHVLVKVKKQMTKNGFSKFFGGYLHVKMCSSYVSYLTYMIHGTWMSQDKIQYPVSALQGSQDIIRSVFGDVDNLNFIQLAEFAEKAETGYSLARIIREIRDIDDDQERKDLIRAFHDNEYIITALTQEHRSLRSLELKEKEHNFQLERSFYSI